MKIAIGALVLCKVLISEPQTGKVNTPAPVNSETSSTRESVGSTSRVYGENPLKKLSQKPRIKEGNIVYTMIEGEVIDVKRESFYAPVKGTSKFELLEEEYLVIKSEEIDHLVISGRACGLKSDFIYDEKAEAEKKAKQAVATKKRKAVESKEEVIIIRGDKIPEGYEVAPVDKATQEALKKEYSRTIQEEERLANEKMLKDLEHDQARFSRKNQTQPQVSPLPEQEAAEQIKEIEHQEKIAPDQTPAVEAKPEKSASELFNDWEADRKKELEAQRQADLADKKKEEERRAKSEEIRAKAEKVEEEAELRKPTPKKTAPVAPAPARSSKEEKSIIKDAFEIITTE